MLRKLIGTVIVGGVAYIVGVNMGFKAAVTDYMENDAHLIKQKVAEREGTEDELREAIEEANRLRGASSEQSEGEDDEDEDGAPGIAIH